MSGFLSIVTDFARRVAVGESDRYCWGLIPREHILDDDFAGGEFRHDQSYLKLRLGEMHLENKREGWFEFLPLCLIAADYFYDGKQRSTPFLVSHERLKEALAKAGAGSVPIELLSTTLLGPVPFVAGDVGLAVALFRTQRSDFAELLLDVLGDLGNAIGPNPVAEALPMAGHIYNGVKRLFGMDGKVQFRFGMRDEFRAGAGGGRPLAGSYLVATNATEDELQPGQLWVRNGRLCKGGSRDALSSDVGHDFCLVAIERHPSRGHYGDLPFHRLWEEIPAMIWDGQIERAEKHAFLNLGKAIATSPDLIETDRSAATIRYTEMFYAQIEQYQRTRKRPQGLDAKRGATRGSVGLDGGIVRLKRVASRAEKTVPEVGKVFRTAAERLEANHDALAERVDHGANVDTANPDWRSRFDQGLSETRKQLAGNPVKAEDLLSKLVDQAFQGEPDRLRS